MSTNATVNYLRYMETSESRCRLHEKLYVYCTETILLAAHSSLLSASTGFRSWRLSTQCRRQYFGFSPFSNTFPRCTRFDAKIKSVPLAGKHGVRNCMQRGRININSVDLWRVCREWEKERDKGKRGRELATDSRFMPFLVCAFYDISAGKS